MNAREALRQTIDKSDFIVSAYLADLTDADLLVRPVAGANHIAWQLGHLLAAENSMISAIVPGSMPALPAGFAEKYKSDTAKDDAAGAFLKKDEYLALYRQQREATLKALNTLSDADLDKPVPDAFKGYTSNWGDLFVLQGIHWTMHAGQWALTRRKLGKPPLF